MEVGWLLAQSRLWHRFLETVPRRARESWRHTVYGEPPQQSSRSFGKRHSLSFSSGHESVFVNGGILSVPHYIRTFTSLVTRGSSFRPQNASLGGEDRKRRGRFGSRGSS